MADIRYNNSFSLAGGFNITNAEPIDSRMYVADIQHIYLPENWVKVKPYPGLIVSAPDGEVRICINSDYTLESSWKKIGGGSISVETYAEAIALAGNDNIGQVIYVKTKSSYDADGEGEGEAVEYDAAPYIVIGEGELQKLAASTASGNLDADVAELKTKVSGIDTKLSTVESTLNTAVADIDTLKEIDHDAYIAADTALKSELQTEINKKVESETYEEKVSAIEDSISDNDTKAQGYAKTAKEEAIDAASLDATTKANAAQAAAQSYADGLNTEMDTRVKNLESIDHDAYIAADTALKSELQAEINKKVESVEGQRLLTNEEGVKLEGIAEGAQVNTIEVIKVNGKALTITDSDKSVDVIVPTAPVQGVAAGDKIISLDGDVLKTTLNLAYVPATETEKAVLRLQGIGGQVISSIDATSFVKDGMLSGAKLDGPKGDETGEKYLSLTFNTDAGVEDIRIDVSDLIDYYSAGNGLNLDGKTFSVKVDETANTYLQVTTNGIAVSQSLIDEITSKANAAQAAAIAAAAEDATSKANAAQAAAITAAAEDATSKTDAAIAAAAEDATSKANAAQAAAITAAAEDATTKANAAQTAAQDYADGLNTTMDTRVIALEGKSHEHENHDVLDGITSAKVSAWDAAEQNAKDYADNKFVTKEGFNEFEAEYEEKLNGIADGAEVNVIESIKVNGINATITDDKAAEIKVDAKDIELGESIMNGEEVKYASNAKISTVLQSIQESIRGAIAGGVNSVSSGDKSIIVNSADANNPVVTLNTEESNEETITSGHIAIIKGDNGIYAAMYYDGDDVE